MVACPLEGFVRRVACSQAKAADLRMRNITQVLFPPYPNGEQHCKDIKCVPMESEKCASMKKENCSTQELKILADFTDDYFFDLSVTRN